MLKFLCPFWVLSVLALFSPLAFSILPLHGADICLCLFFDHKAESKWRKYPVLTTDSYQTLQVVSTLSLYSFGYAVIIAFVHAVYKIRHLNDNTLISRECMFVVGWWLSIVVPQFIILTLLFAQRCYPELHLH